MYFNKTEGFRTAPRVYMLKLQDSWKKKKKDLNRWRDILCLQTERLNIVKKSILSKLNYRLSAFSIKIPAGFFCKYWPINCKIYKTKEKE